MIPECSSAHLTVGLQCFTTHKTRLTIQTRPQTGHNSSEEDAVMSYGRSKDGSILLEVCENVACASGHACGAGRLSVAQVNNVHAAGQLSPLFAVCVASISSCADDLFASTFSYANMPSVRAGTVGNIL